jgi:hypothetical protein
MTPASLLATSHISPNLLLMLATFLLLKQGLGAATHPKCSRLKAFRNLLITVASVICLVAAAGVLQLCYRLSDVGVPF